MKTPTLLLIATLALLSCGCVQQTKPQKVTYLLDVSGAKPIESVGIRGSDSPLSWETDLAMTPIVKDSLYRAEVTYNTGYKVTEVKFTLNGNFEMLQENRTIRFEENGATQVSVVFNQP